MLMLTCQAVALRGALVLVIDLIAPPRGACARRARLPPHLDAAPLRPARKLARAFSSCRPRSSQGRPRGNCNQPANGAETLAPPANKATFRDRLRDQRLSLCVDHRSELEGQ